MDEQIIKLDCIDPLSNVRIYLNIIYISSEKSKILLHFENEKPVKLCYCVKALNATFLSPLPTSHPLSYANTLNTLRSGLVSKYH